MNTAETISAFSLVVALGALLVSLKTYLRSKTLDIKADVEQRRKALYELDIILERTVGMTVQKPSDLESSDSISTFQTELKDIRSRINNSIQVISESPLGGLAPFLGECGIFAYRMISLDFDKLKDKDNKLRMCEALTQFYKNMLKIAIETFQVRESTDIGVKSRIEVKKDPYISHISERHLAFGFLAAKLSVEMGSLKVRIEEIEEARGQSLKKEKSNKKKAKRHKS